MSQQIRLRWLTSDGATAPVVARVRSVSERAAFALIATSHGAGTRGSYELLDERGNVIRSGSCRILFQRQGAGVGLELLARPPLRRSTLPAERSSGPPPDSSPGTIEAPRIPKEALQFQDDDAPERILGARPSSRPSNRPSSPPRRSSAPPRRGSNRPPSSVSEPPHEHALDPRAPTEREVPLAESAPPPPTPSAPPDFDLPVIESEAPTPVESEPPPRLESDAPRRPLSAPFPSPSARPPPARPFSQRPPAPGESEPPKPARLATRIGGRGARQGVAIGIDLGTSNTCASAVIDGVPRVIPTRFGTSTIPSVLTVIDSRVVVGHAAAKRMILNPHETVYGSKRLVGRVYTEQLAEDYQPFFAYPLAETESHQFGASLKGRVISFEEVAEHLLAEVRDVAEQFLKQPIDRAVITVPSYFGEAQRESVRRAARGARLNVDRIVPEPTAAAVAYGYGATATQTLVVFDLGGGTFDVSVLRLRDNEFEVLATGGDAFLGGIDIDDLLANALLEQFNATERTTLEPSPQQLARLRDAAEECKCGLSMQNKFAVRLHHFARVGGEPKDLNAAITRAQLDALAGGFCDRLMAITASTLADCRLSPKEVDEVLLVGGMTRMALVPERVEKYFGRRPAKRINPDEAVALGAARLAEDGGKVKLIDVLPLSIGVASEGRRFLRLIPRNTAVPTERHFTLHTEKKNETTRRLPLFQGERTDASENEYLGTVVVDEIPAGDAGAEIEIAVALDEQCFLEISARHVESDRSLPVHISREEGADKAIAHLGDYDGPREATHERTGSALGRFFKKLRSIFR